MEPSKNGCAVKHAKLAGLLIVLLLAVAVTVTLAMTAGIGEGQAALEARLRKLEVGQAAQVERDKAIQAIVERGDAAPVPGAADGLSPQVRLTVANDATEGIASSELDTGGDRVRVAPRVGGEARTMEITRILYHDSGALVLELR